MPWRASRDPAVQDQWRRRVAAYEASGQSMAAFCVGQDFGRESLSRWRRWLARHDALVPALVEVKVREDAPPPPPRDTMVVELAGSRRLILEPGFDPAAVALLVATLERL